MNGESVCSELFKPVINDRRIPSNVYRSFQCVIPFLANLFGKYLTLDPGNFCVSRVSFYRYHYLLDAKFPYSVSNYNSFTCYEELGPLCNHVMSQLLSRIGRTNQLVDDRVHPFGETTHTSIGLMLGQQTC